MCEEGQKLCKTKGNAKKNVFTLSSDNLTCLSLLLWTEDLRLQVLS